MTRSALRAALYAIGGLAIAGAVVLALFGCGPAAIGLAGWALVLVVGLLVWRFKHVRAIGDNMVTAGLLVLLANLLQWLHKRMARSKVELFHRLSQKLSKYE